MNMLDRTDDVLGRLAAVPVPPRMRLRPRDGNGLPIPFTAPNGPILGKIDPTAWATCLRHGWCGLCGLEIEEEPLYFVGGPLCAENRLFADPPMHRTCADYDLRVCRLRDVAGDPPPRAAVFEATRYEKRRRRGQVWLYVPEYLSVRWYTIADFEAREVDHAA